MDARLARAAILLAATLSLGAGYRSENFIVSAPTPQLAAEVCIAAENYRRDLAIEWLGHELPPWRQPCPITAQVNSQLGAGGETSFMFDGGVPFGWTMRVQGSRERVLDSVLPHEVTHTIFATHFGRPLPRWADEGACTTVEHVSEKAKQDRFLIQFLTTDRGIPFNKMFAMREYPRDILPLYAQGYSLARYLIQQGGKQKFIRYVGDGMASGNWPAATHAHYGFRSLSELQVTWVEWVRQGSPNLEQANVAAIADMRGVAPSSAAASASAQPAPPTGPAWQTAAAQNARTFALAEGYAPPPSPSAFDANPHLATGGQSPASSSSVSRPVSEGWYAKQRDQAQQIRQAAPAPTPTTGGYRDEPQMTATTPSGLLNPQSSPALNADGQAMQLRSIPAPPTRTAAPGVIPAGRRVLMEWTRESNQPAASDPGVSGLARLDDGRLHR